MAISLASTSTTKSLEKSGNWRTGALTRADFTSLNAFSWATPHTKGASLQSKACNGAAMLANA